MKCTHCGGQSDQGCAAAVSLVCGYPTCSKCGHPFICKKHLEESRKIQKREDKTLWEKVKETVLRHKPGIGKSHFVFFELGQADCIHMNDKQLDHLITIKMVQARILLEEHIKEDRDAFHDALQRVYNATTEDK